MRAKYTKDHIKALIGFSLPTPGRIRVKAQVPFILSKHNKWQNKPSAKTKFQS